METQEYIKNTKVCTKCGAELELSKEFFPKGRNSDGFGSWCKNCVNVQKKEYHVKKLLALGKAPRFKPMHRIDPLTEKVFKDCSRCRKELQLKFFSKDVTHSDGLRSICKFCYHEDAVLRWAPNKKIKVTPEEAIKNRRLKRRDLYKKSKKNPVFQITLNCRGRMYKVLRGNFKAGKSFDLIGCSSVFLREYLESKFLFGMTWENYGINGWNIDHIKPLASFDMSDPEQQKASFHYTNLQPLWWIDNLRKGDKLI